MMQPGLGPTRFRTATSPLGRGHTAPKQVHTHRTQNLGRGPNHGVSSWPDSGTTLVSHNVCHNQMVCNVAIRGAQTDLMKPFDRSSCKVSGWPDGTLEGQVNATLLAAANRPTVDP